MTICINCRHGNFIEWSEPTCKAQNAQRIPTLHPVYGHECFRYSESLDAISFGSERSPPCRLVNLFGQCPHYEAK